MSSQNYHQYHEFLPGDLNIQHKIAPATEKVTFHLHSHMEVIYTVSDNLMFYSEHSARHLPAGALLLLDSMCLHHIDYLKTGYDCDRYVLYFNPNLVLRMNTPEVNLLDCFLRCKEDGLILLPDPEEGSRLAFSLERMLSCLSGHNLPVKGDPSSLPPMDRAFLRLELGQFLLQINRLVQKSLGAPESASYQAHSQTVSEICRFIDTNYAEPLSIDEISRKFLMSKTQLYNIFKEVMHMSVTDYLSHVRMTQAKSLLINTEYSLEIISQKAGYTNISSFSRVFKTKTGIGPLQYRKKYN